jgi:hypothetical protein
MILCSRRRRFVAASYPADDGNDDHCYRSKRTYCSKDAERALGGAQENEQEENASCRGIDLIDAVKEAPNLGEKAPLPPI